MVVANIQFQARSKQILAGQANFCGGLYGGHGEGDGEGEGGSLIHDQYMQFVLVPIGCLLSSPEKPKYFQTATFVLQVEDFLHP